MTDKKRLIEVAFPLKQTSLDSVHEKNVRHGHISTLHIWPARRPLAACRAALIATLLPDPEDDAERRRILEKLGGHIVKRTKRVGGEEKLVEETEGGILHWGRESGPDLDWFREKIREAYGGRAPRVLDPFAGGGAIPLEAMRLGCEATAVDINPVAWFILKCTLEYPQKLAGQTCPLPDFARQDGEFMQAFLKAKGFSGAALQARLAQLGGTITNAPMFPGFASPSGPLSANGEGEFDADLAWHVRAWGRWVLAQARRDLARFYPTYADFEPLVEVAHKVAQRPMQLVPLKEDGTADIDALNAEFDPAYLAIRSNPRWVAKPTVAYLWARTVTCKNCRATVPLLKTRWLCKKDKKRVALGMQPNPEKTGVVFSVQSEVPVVGKTGAERRAYDQQVGGGTMSRSGATCPCCGAIMTMDDIRLEGQAGRLGTMMTAVAIDGQKGKEYRLPTDIELQLSFVAETELGKEILRSQKLGLDTPMMPASTRSISCHLYGVRIYRDLFTSRQISSLGSIASSIHLALGALREKGYSEEWINAILGYLALGFDRLVSFTNVNVRWKMDAEAVVDAFARFSISLLWDFAEPQPIGNSAGSWQLCYERIATALDTYQSFPYTAEKVNVLNASAAEIEFPQKFDLILTDPPYYQAISYADLSDFFYVWLRGVFPLATPEFVEALTSKEKEIVQHIREDKDRIQEKAKYEEGMFEAFSRIRNALNDEGRFVCVFAHKDPVAWETLVSAMIRAGLVVTASWPIQTEMISRQRASESASLSSSVWLVCKKRPETARPGWDNRVLEGMRQKIAVRLRDFWDAGIRGPDFVWAATGPALEAYSQYPAVKKANQPGQLMAVSEFLNQVRRMVVNFVVGRVLSKDGGEETVSGLDDVTAYYLLHRHDFGFEDAPAGACILYAVSCGLSDKDLADRYDLLARSGGASPPDPLSTEDGEGEEEPESEGSGSSLRLKTWQQRKRPSLGYDPALDAATAHLPMFPEVETQVTPSREVPLIDQVHRLMHLWKAGDATQVDNYLDIRGLRRNQLFHQLLQALIEVAEGEERTVLERISNHVGAMGQSLQTNF